MVQDSQTLHNAIDIFQQFGLILVLIYFCLQELESACQSEFQTCLDLWLIQRY